MILVGFPFVFQNAAQTVAKSIDPLNHLHNTGSLVNRTVSIRIGRKNLFQGFLASGKQGKRQIENIAGSVYGLEISLRIGGKKLCNFRQRAVQNIGVKLFKGLRQTVFEHSNIKGIFHGIVRNSGKGNNGIFLISQIKGLTSFLIGAADF